MSYQPEPDTEQELPKLFALKRRLVSFKNQRPAAFWFRTWLLTAVIVLPVLLMSGFEGFQRPSHKALLAISVTGWVYPFFLWIKQRKERDQ
ncbi:hypothetical protein [Leisingera sp. JC1]|uniref:hypothetical protein n=1 Tax=Leisingera sp. JC1 TaxID=1855282 RepID=UPI000803844C|nr:hypothetical protein [Leisingera sp. JC1]OBY28842.1 hypothetical protein A9D60_01535 [Leisingera sp. JC1]